MKNIYGDRLNVIWGDSTQTIKNTPNLNCDVFFVDGGSDAMLRPEHF